MTHEEDIAVALFVYFKSTPGARKYDNPANREIIADRIRSYRVQVSDTAVVRAVSELLQEGEIERIDGGNEQTDAINAARIREAKEKAHLDRVAEAPLSPEEIEFFQRLSQAELRQLYFGDREFKVRFDLAVERFGFQRPLATQHPTPVTVQKITAIPTATAVEEPITLTRQEYHSIPTRTIQQRYASSPAFKAAVDRLIVAGQI